LVQVTSDYEAGFLNFLSKFLPLRRLYQSPEAIQRIVYEAIADAASENIKYLELRFNPVALARLQNFPYGQVMDWVWEAAQAAQADHDIIVRLIISVIRQEPVPALAAFEAALDRVGRGIVAFDLSGDEVNYPLDPFIPMFNRAREAGLYLNAHAGEAGGAENVREVIEKINPPRIGHGVRCIENSDVVKMVRDRGITLEICPTSNLQTGVMRIMGHHPLPDLYQLGLKVTINTDDPSISDTTLTDEYYLAVSSLGISLSDLKSMIMNAVQAAYLPPDEKSALIARFHKELGL
jgi:adenosine deaminase